MASGKAGVLLTGTVGSRAKACTFVQAIYP